MPVTPSLTARPRGKPEPRRRKGKPSPDHGSDEWELPASGSPEEEAELAQAPEKTAHPQKLSFSLSHKSGLGASGPAWAVLILAGLLAYVLVRLYGG
jgi:hypothetical protein